MKNKLLEKTKTVLVCLLFLSIFGGKYPISNVHAETVPQEQKLGWSQWQQWDTFPHQQLQLGMSNSDYGAMMDLEYKCFGEVNSNNDAQKSDSYWYRISDQEKTSEYLKIEVGCWQENQFKATAIVNGLKINNQSSAIIITCPREFTGWNLIKAFETDNYSLALCKKESEVYLVGFQKKQHEYFISAKVIEEKDNLILAQDDDNFLFEIANNQLTITQNNQLIATELIIKTNPDQEPDLSSNNNLQNNLGFGGPSTVENELREDRITREKRSLLPSVDNSLQPWFNWKQEVNQEIGLNFGLDYNAVYQNIEGDLKNNEASGGIFRFFGDWTLLGRNTNSSGTLVFKVENRHDFSRVAPQNLGFQAGYLGITSTQFSDYGWGVTNLYWKQQFNQGRIAFLIGKVDPTDYLDVYGLINPLTAFQNLSFATNPTIAAPNQGLGMGLGAMLSDNIYLLTGFSDANGDATKAGFDTFFNDAEYFKHFEIGWTSSQERIYLDNINLTVWHSDARDKANTPESWGLAFSAAWFIDDSWMPFLRGGYSDGGASLMKGSVSTGLGRYFPESGNLFGLGINWGQPADSSLESQVTTEVFYRLQLTQNLAVTPNLQILFNPALNPDRFELFVFGIRTRLNF